MRGLTDERAEKLNIGERTSFIERLKLSKIALLILTSIRRDGHQWKCNDCRFENPTVGLSLWIGNGRQSFCIKEGFNISPETLTSTELDAIWKAYQQWAEMKKAEIETRLELAIGGIDVSLV